MILHIQMFYQRTINECSGIKTMQIGLMGKLTAGSQAINVKK